MTDVLHPPSPDVSSRDERLAEVVLEYLKAIDAGEQPDPQEILARHPDLAGDLKEFFDDQGRVEGRMAPLRLTVVETTSAIVPRRIGDYAILGEIARGGMGVVYKALQVSARRTVALKMLRQDIPMSEIDLQRFRREEIASVANLDHPNIVPVYEVGDHQGRPFFSMKWIEGANLSSPPAGLAKNYGKLARLMVTVAQAVQHAHSLGVIHRDLKPANVMLDKNGQPHVTDFGLAKRVPIDPATVVTAEANNTTMTELAPPAFPPAATGLTPRNALAGTPPYMSPEAATSDRRVTTAIDVYGLGAIFYELLAGRPPFHGETLVQTLADVIHKEPVRPRKVRPGVPADLEAICLMCLKKKPKDRYASAEAVAEDLQNYLENRPTKARPVSPPERLWKWAQRQPVIAALLLTVLAVSATGVGAFWMQLRQTEIEVKNAQYDLHALKLRDSENKIFEGYLDQAHDILHECLDRFRLPEWHLMNRWSEGITDPWPGHESDVQRVCSSGDGTMMASGDSAGGVRLWLMNEPGRSIVLQPENTGTGAVTSLMFSADGGRLAVAFANTTVKVWDTKHRTVVFQKSGLGRYAALNRDGSLLGTAGRPDPQRKATDLVEIWDVATAVNLKTFRHGGEVTSLGFVRNGSLLVSAGYGEEIVKFWNVHGYNAAEPRLRKSSKLWAIDLAIHPTKDWIAAVQGNTISLWDLKTGAEYPLQRGDLSRCNSIAFSADGRYLAGVYLSGVVVVWDVEGKRPDFSARRSHKDKSIKEMLASVCFVRDGAGEQIAYGRGVGIIMERWKVRHNRPTLTWAGPSPIRRLTFHPLTGKLVGATEEGPLFELEVPAGKERILNRTAAGLTALTYSPDGASLVGAADRSVQILHPQSGKVEVLLQTDHAAPITGLAIAAKQPLLATSSHDKSFHVRHRESLKEFFKSKTLLGPLFAVAFDPDGKRLVVGGGDGLLQVWGLESQEAILTLKGHEHDVTSVAFSPDGRWLASSGADARVILWDARSGKEVCRFLGHIGTVSGVAFNRDGNRLASAGMDGTVKLWDASSENLLRVSSRARAQGKRPTQAPLLSLKTDSPVKGVTFGTGLAENWLAATHADGKVRLWDGSPGA